MITVDDVALAIDSFAPKSLAEEWDNVGLLVGDRDRPVRRVMTCLTITPASAREAIEGQADVIVTHHPLPFRSLKRLTTDTPEGRLLLELIAARIAIHSPHTAFDSTALGINQQFAEGLQLQEIEPIRPADPPGSFGVGAGRWGKLSSPAPVAAVIERIKAFLKIDRVQLVGDPQREVQTVAIACGSAGEFLAPARKLGCELLITGETSFHTCLEAEATGVSLVLVGHYASERFAVEWLATFLAQQLAHKAEVWASQAECSPLLWL